ncbi:MAG: hypothetical protein NVS3B26_18350 [Mycobacteriales bacterium]
MLISNDGPAPQLNVGDMPGYPLPVSPSAPAQPVALTTENDGADYDRLARLRAGDEAVFRDLVDDLSPVLLRLARTYTPTSSAAQDAVQDTWLTVIDKLDTFEGRSTLKTWICGILVHKARRAGVRESRVLPFSSAWRDDHAAAVDPSRFHSRRDAGPTGTWSSPPVRWDDDPEDELERHELRAQIDAAIELLPVRQREVIVARDVVGMDAAEASDLLGVTAGNQRVLLHRARSKVRAELECHVAEFAAGASRRRRGVSMNQQAFRRAVVCQQLVEMVTDYLEGDLSPTGRAAVEEHLAHCEHCAGYIEQVRRLLELTAGGPGDHGELPAELVDALTTRYRVLH